MQQYELAVLYDPGLELDIEKATAKVEQLITSNGGEIVSTDNWGKKKMMYQIKKQDFAIYVFYTLNLPAQAVRKINDTLNITDEVVRFLITKTDLKKLVKAEAARADKAAKAAARGEKTEGNSEDESEE